MSVDRERIERVRNPRGQGERLRTEILDATRKLLENTDAHAVTLRSIARQAGVAAPSIYRHFSDLNAIMTAVVEDAFEDLRVALVHAGRSPVSALRLVAICRSYLAYASEHPQQYRLMFGGVWRSNATTESGVSSERMGNLGLAAFDVLVQAVQDCIDDGASESRTARDDAAALWASLHGLAELQRTTPSFPWPPTTLIHLIQRIALLSERAIATERG